MIEISIELIEMKVIEIKLTVTTIYSLYLFILYLLLTTTGYQPVYNKI